MYKKKLTPYRRNCPIEQEEIDPVYKKKLTYCIRRNLPIVQEEIDPQILIHLRFKVYETFLSAIAYIDFQKQSALLNILLRVCAHHMKHGNLPNFRLVQITLTRASATAPPPDKKRKKNPGKKKENAFCQPSNFSVMTPKFVKLAVSFLFLQGHFAGISLTQVSVKAKFYCKTI